MYNLEVADNNTYFVGDEAVLVHNYNPNDPHSDQDVYVLYDKDTKEIQYVGRSVDGERRLQQHKNSANRKHLEGKVVAKGLKYEEGRGLEQIGIERFDTLKKGNAPFNQINGVNPDGKWYDTFKNAGSAHESVFDDLLKFLSNLRKK